MDPSGRSELDQAFARFASGRDPEDLAKVFDGASPRLLLVGMHLLGDTAAAEDLLQATFLDAIRGVDRFDPNRPVMPWLLTILTRRAGKLRRGRGLEKRVETELDALQADEKEPSDQAAEREVIEQISDAVESLSVPYREVLMLRLVHDLRPVEIARTLNRPLGTVHAQLHRGLERLRRILPKSLAGALAMLVGAERGLAAVRQRVLPVVLPVVGGLWMKKLVVAAVAVLVLLATGTWALVGEHGAAMDSQPMVPEMSQVSLSASKPSATEENPVATPSEERLPVVAASKNVVFTGRVVAAESGASIAGAEVSLQAFQSGRRNPGRVKWDDPSVVTSGMDGRFEIAIAQYPGMGIGFSAHVPGRVKTAGSVSELRSGVSVELGDVPVFAGSEVHIRVIDDQGEPVEGVGLQLDPDSRSDSVHLGGLISLHPRGWGGIATTDTSGWVLPVRLQPGRWHVLIDHSSGLGFTGPSEILVESSDRARAVTIVLSTPNSESTISGTVVDMRGQRMPGFELRGMQEGRIGYSSVRSRSDGSFLFGVLAPERGPVTASLKDQRHFELISPMGAVEVGTSGLEVVIKSIEATALAIEVVDKDQKPVEEFRYCLVPTRRDRWGTRLLEHSLKMSNEVLHRDGHVLVEGVLPGPYLLYVRGENTRLAPVQSISIDVRPGDPLCQDRCRLEYEELNEDRGAPADAKRL